MQNRQKNSVSLILITNDSNQKDECHQISKKLDDIGVSLQKKQTISASDYNQLLARLIEEIEIKDEDQFEWVLFVTNSKLYDPLIEKLIGDISKLRELKIDKIKKLEYSHVYLYENRIFMLKNESFNLEFSFVIQHIYNSNRIFLEFKERSDVDKFDEKLSQLINQNGIETSQVVKNLFFSNYSKFCFEVLFKKFQDVKKIRMNLCEDILLYSDITILAISVLADSYLYEFDYYSKYLTTDQMMLENREDIQFLLKKIDLEIFSKKLQDSLKVIEESLRRYSIEQICLSFNGGKDCLVVLYLFYGVCLRMGVKFPLNILLINIENQFDEMTDFINKEVVNFFGRYSIKFITFEPKPIKECLRILKETNPNIKGILMGTRRTDNEYLKKMNAFSMTDGDWPEFMRINPILDWSFSEIWFLIRLYKIPYCILYDFGFTSIDNKLNTIPNKDLCKPNNQGYFPAYLLENQETERTSRAQSK